MQYAIAWLAKNWRQLAVAVVSAAVVYVILFKPDHTKEALVVAGLAGAYGLHLPPFVYRLAGVLGPDASPATPNNASDKPS